MGPRFATHWKRKAARLAMLEKRRRPGLQNKGEDGDQVRCAMYKKRKAVRFVMYKKRKSVRFAMFGKRKAARFAMHKKRKSVKDV
jgi:hypothetical protein